MEQPSASRIGAYIPSGAGWIATAVTVIDANGVDIASLRHERSRASKRDATLQAVRALLGLACDRRQHPRPWHSILGTRFSAVCPRPWRERATHGHQWYRLLVLSGAARLSTAPTPGLCHGLTRPRPAARGELPGLDAAPGLS